MMLRVAKRFQSNAPLYLNPHMWQGLPADQVFELHKLRQQKLGDKYTPTDEERHAVLSTVAALSNTKQGPKLDYVYALDNFKEKYMNNVPVAQRSDSQKLSNVEVLGRGDTPHIKRRHDHLTRVAAYEMPLLAKFAQEYVPAKAKELPLQMTYHTDFSDDPTLKFNRKVLVQVRLADLALTKPQQHKFKLLAGNKFNLDTNVFKMTCQRYPESAQNARFLVETVAKLVEAAKDPSDDFADIPVDPRHMRYHIKKPEPQFPEEWKRPEDAPQAKHKVVNRLVSQVIAKKDQQYLDDISA